MPYQPSSQIGQEPLCSRRSLVSLKPRAGDFMVHPNFMVSRGGSSDHLHRRCDRRNSDISQRSIAAVLSRRRRRRACRMHRSACDNLPTVGALVPAMARRCSSPIRSSACNRSWSAVLDRLITRSLRVSSSSESRAVIGNCALCQHLTVDPLIEEAGVR